MFRQYPYKGWLFISLLLWGIAITRFYSKKAAMAPAAMAAVIEEDLQKKEKNFNVILTDNNLLNRLISDQLTEDDVKKLTYLPYHIYVYNADTLRFWNTNNALEDCNSSYSNFESLLNNESGSYVKKCISLPGLGNQNRLIVLFPIVTNYPFENSYLRSHFEAEDYIPINTKLTTRAVKGSFAIKSIDGKNIFYASFANAESANWIPRKLLLWILTGAFLTGILWLQLITINLTRKRNPFIGFAFTFLSILFIRFVTYKFGLPFNLQSLPIFSPLLYASSTFLPSLGDLLLNAFCLLWMVVFTIRHVPLYNIAKWPKNKTIKFFLCIALSVLLVWFNFYIISVIKSLVVDSRISFDVSHFYSITFYTIVGLFTIAVITASSCLMVYMFNTMLNSLIKSKVIKHAILVLAGLFVILFFKNSLSITFCYILLSWLLLFILFLDFKSLTYVSDLFSPRMIFWAVFVCLFCTGVLEYFVHLKDIETRKIFAEQIVKQRDYVTEYTFKTISQQIQSDRLVTNFFKSPTAERRRLLNERFDAVYLEGQLNKYQPKVLLFDGAGRSMYNKDTTSYKTLYNELADAEVTSDTTLYYKEFSLDGRYYMARIPVYDNDSLTQLGYVFIDFAIKESAAESVYPELLQPGNIQSNINSEGYSYGVYVHNKLITQTNDYSFQSFITNTQKDKHTFYTWDESSEYWYKADEAKTVIVIRYNRLWLEIITLFSYLFGIQMLIVVVIVIYRIGLSYFTKPKLSNKLIHLTLRNRIHFSMLGIVLVSFTIIGFVTIFYFTYQYKQSNKKKVLMTMQVVERSALQFLKEQNSYNTQSAFNDLTTSPKFKYFLSNLANAQEVDINVYKASGILSVSSQENIYDKNLLARIIRPDAYYKLTKQNSSFELQDERIGLLSYLSCYVTLKNEQGITLGYINVPFFSSQKELNFQISNILVALINLYAFIFLISSVLTVFITRWITRTLSVVINRFERLNLTRNEAIDWPYDDEIGLLVQEYNKMVRKVEENALTLAQNEREMAWREMAMQIAHEIKNPLTPMKLNIQHLQHAIKNGYSNIEAMAAKVYESLIEQIDNLSYIASEFSNFAKMPDAKPEEIELNALLTKATELYLNEPNVSVKFNKLSHDVKIFSDRSQLLRVFTNLLENAVQAIPEDKPGKITVLLTPEDDSVLITFTDNGVGIDDEVVERIFQPYFTTKTSGTGLGLAMTKKLIEFWKGSIWFETVADQGTTFYIKLPVVKTDTTQ